MKRNLLLCSFLLTTALCFSMKITKDETDEFTGKRTLITSWENINKSAWGNSIGIRFRLQNGNEYLDLKWSDQSPHVVGTDDPLMFKSTSDAITEFTPTRIEGSTTRGNGIKSGIWTLDATYKGDINYFKDNVIRLIRIYTSDGYIDEKVSEKDGKQICKLYDLFNSALTGEVGSIAYANYTLTFVKKKTSSKTWDKVKEEYKEDLSKDEVQQIVDEWKAQSNENYEYDCKVKKEK